MGKINSNVVESLSYLNAGSIADNAENSAILEAIYNNGNAVDDVCLHSAICTEFGVDIPPQRLSEILRRLVESGQLIKTANSEYELSSVLAAEILEAKVSFNELERRFIGQWINDNSKASSLSDDEKQALFSLAVQFIKTLFVQHGVSSYNFLTNQYTAVTFSINDIVKTLSVTLSKDLQDIASVTLPILLASPISQDGLNYYKETINRVTAYRSIAVPTETMQLIKAKLNGLTVYLDTNVLYRILNLQGEYRYETVKLVIDELQNAGVIFCVTPVTLSELKKRLAYDASVITKHIVPCNLAELGYNYRASDNYVSTFWKVRAKTRVSADDFNAKYSQVESLLLDLEIMTESSPIIPDNEIEDSRKEVFSKLGIYDSDKKPNAAWDDSYNVAYVKHRQKKGAATALDTQFLFMTSDQGLFNMQKNDFEFKANPPVVVLPSQLLQIISFIKPINDYYRTFIDLFSSAANFRQNEYSNNDIQDLMGRISFYGGENENIAVKILSDKLFVSKFAAAHNDSERDEIIYSEATKLLNEELQTTVTQLNEAEKKLSTSTQEKNNLHQKTIDLQDTLAALTQTMQRKTEKADEELNNLKSEIQTKAQYIDHIKADYIKKKWENWLRGKVISLICSAALFLFIGLSLLIPAVREMTVQQLIGTDNTMMELFYGFLELPLAAWFAFSCKVFSPNVKGKIRKEYEDEFEANFGDIQK